MGDYTQTQPKNSDFGPMPRRNFSPLKAIGNTFAYIKNNPWFVSKFIFMMALFKASETLVRHFSNFSRLSLYPHYFDISSIKYAQLITVWIEKTDWRLMALGWLFLFPFSVSVTAMLFRRALFNKSIGLWGLSFGKDELNLSMAFFLIALPEFFTSTIWFEGIFAIEMGEFLFSEWIFAIAIFCLFIWVALRLAQSKVTVMARRKFDLKEIWSETKNNVLNLLGLYILLSLVILVFYLPIFGLNFLFYVNEFQDFAFRIEQKYGAIVLGLNVEFIALLVVGSIFSSTAALVVLLASVSVYKQMNPDFAPTPPNTPTENP